MKHSVTVVDYGSGNLLSTVRALETCGATVYLSDDHELIRNSRFMVIPGVGAFSECMDRFHTRGLVEPVLEALSRGAVVLGICVGMQILFDRSEEFGITDGLGLIPGVVRQIPASDTQGMRQKVPNVGWRQINEPTPGAWNGTILQGITPGSFCYFVHSFAGTPCRNENRLADITYGGRPLCAAVKKGTLFGTQFHPEKSGEIGLKIFRNFLSFQA